MLLLFAAVLMTPTRELALQTFKECKKFAKTLGLRVACVYGGTGISEQVTLPTSKPLLLLALDTFNSRVTTASPNKHIFYGLTLSVQRYLLYID